MISLKYIFKKVAFKNTTIYVIISFMQKGIGFFLLPLYTGVLTPTDYGTVNVVNTIVGFLSIIYGLSLHGAAVRFYFKYKNDPDRVSKMWGSCFTFVLINSLILSTLIGVFHKSILDPLAQGIPFHPYILLGLISTGLSPVYVYFQAMLLAEQNGKSYGINNLVSFLLNLFLTLFFVLILRWAAVGILAANALTNAVFFIYGGIRMLPRIRICLNWKLLSEALWYSLPLTPYNLSSFVAVMIDRLFLNNMKGTESVGLYSVGYQFANIMNIITAAVLQAYSPWFFEQIEKGAEGRKNIRRNIGIVVSVFAFIGVNIACISPLLMRFMVNTRFSESWKVVPPLVLGYSIYGVYLLTCNELFASKTYYLPVVTMLGAFLNVVLNFFIVPRLGVFGAAISSLLYNLFITVFLAILVERVEHVGYTLFSLAMPFLICAPAILFVFFLPGLGLTLNIIVAFLIIIISGLMLYFFNKDRIGAILNGV